MDGSSRSNKERRVGAASFGVRPSTVDSLLGLIRPALMVRRNAAMVALLDVARRHGPRRHAVMQKSRKSESKALGSDRVAVATTQRVLVTSASLANDSSLDSDVHIRPYTYILVLFVFAFVFALVFPFAISARVDAPSNFDRIVSAGLASRHHIHMYFWGLAKLSQAKQYS